MKSVAAFMSAMFGQWTKKFSAVNEAFIAGCYEKAEEVDDSSGAFGQFVEGLFLAWIRARQAAGAAPDETVRALLRWIESDDYGYCSGLERSAVKALDRKGRAAFEHEMRRRFEAAAGNAGDDDRRADYARRRWGSALKSLYAETKNVAAYAALCEQTDLTAEDCEIVVGILQARGKFQEALGWVERGLDIQKGKGRASAGGYKLPEMRRSLLRRLGRGAEALESAWEQYQKEPNQFAYEKLMRYISRADKATWHARAMEASAQGDLSMVIDLWLKTKEIGGHWGQVWILAVRGDTQRQWRVPCGSSFPAPVSSQRGAVLRSSAAHAKFAGSV